MAIPTPVNGQITDAVTQANVKVLGDAPAMAMGSIFQSLAHSTGILYENAVSAQQQIGITSQAVHFRHANVGDNDARPAVLDAFKRSSSSPEDFDMDIGKLERLLCGFSHIFIVINKQDAFCGCRH